jgi:hypothetical protein
MTLRSNLKVLADTNPSKTNLQYDVCTLRQVLNNGRCSARKLSENSCFGRQGADARMIGGADGLDVV